MAITWTNTSKTDLILPHGTVVPAGLTILDRLEAEFDAVVKNPIMKFLIDTGVLKHAKDATGTDTAVVQLFNGGPVAGSANSPTLPVMAALPASDPGPGSNPPNASAVPQVVKASDGTHEVLVNGEVVASGLTKKEATDLAADPAASAPAPAAAPGTAQNGTIAPAAAKKS